MPFLCRGHDSSYGGGYPTPAIALIQFFFTLELRLLNKRVSEASNRLLLFNFRKKLNLGQSLQDV